MLALFFFAVAAAQPAASVTSTTEDIVVDGILDEAAWSTAAPITEFLRFQPVDGGPPPGRTEVRFLQDDKHLYVGIRVSAVDYRVRARVSQRERINADDQIGIYLDTFRDERSGYIFYLNALGIQQDIRHNNGTWNANWDTAFRSRGRVTDDGFEIEIAFPWRSLKFQPGTGEQTWGVLITRKIPGEGAKYSYPVQERGHPRLFSQAAPLTGVRPPSVGSGLELIPALTALQIWSEEEDGTGPDFTELAPPTELLRPSLDTRLGITPDLGFAGALNPDFSQVEADIADVRLNARFAFQFPERRPFFLDGIDLYQDRQDSLYTRSIADPLYGVKLSGREGPLSIGVMNALDRSPLPSFHENPTPGFTEDEVEDRWAQNTVARLRLDAFGTGSVGLIAADKRILGSPLRSGSAGVHDLGGVDAVVPLGGRWIAGGSTVHSSTTAEPGAPTLYGASNEASLRRASGVGTGLSLAVTDRTPGFRQETGFLTQSGLTTVNGSADHTFTPAGLVDTWTPTVWSYAIAERNPEQDRLTEIGHRERVVVNGIHTLQVAGSLSQRREQRSTVNGWWLNGSWSGQLGALLDFTPSASASRGLDFGTLGPADTLDASLDTTLRPTAGIRIDTTVSATRHTPEGQAPELAQLVRSRINWQFTRALGLRFVGQHAARDQAEGESRELLLSTLFTWLEVPGTAAYVGWNERIDLLSGETAERTVFAKVSVLLRP